MSFAGTLTSGATELINAYERLIMDVIRGNQTLFMRGDEVEASLEMDRSRSGCQPYGQHFRFRPMGQGARVRHQPMHCWPELDTSGVQSSHRILPIP